MQELTNKIISGLDETVKFIESMGGYCKGYVVDISKKEEVYKAAEEIKNNIGDVSILSNPREPKLWQKNKKSKIFLLSICLVLHNWTWKLFALTCF